WARRDHSWRRRFSFRVNFGIRTIWCSLAWRKRFASRRGGGRRRSCLGVHFFLSAIFFRWTCRRSGGHARFFGGVASTFGRLGRSFLARSRFRLGFCFGARGLPHCRLFDAVLLARLALDEAESLSDLNRV